MRLYDFDGVPEDLPLLPLAARRALDACGIKLSREGFRSLPPEQRVRLVEAGEADLVDVRLVNEILSAARPAGAPQAPRAEPEASRVPEVVAEALGPGRPLSDKLWQTLRPLDRYSLLKVCERARAERIEAAYREIVGHSALSTHLGPEGHVRMVRVSDKVDTQRRASAETFVTLSAEAFRQLTQANAPKGDVLAVARVAGIMATKRTADLIPLCHPVALSHAEIRFEELPEQGKVRVLCHAEVKGPTGVEMEAMTGATVAALTIYDMLKSVDRGMALGPTRLLEKSGGRSGSFRADPAPAPVLAASPEADPDGGALRALDGSGREEASAGPGKTPATRARVSPSGSEHHEASAGPKEKPR